MKIDGVVHDNVANAKKRVKVNGKLIWKAPSYVKVTTHRVDRTWRFVKDRIVLNHHCKAGSRLMRIKVRNAQYL